MANSNALRTPKHAALSGDDPRNEIAFPRLTQDQVATLAAFATPCDVREGDLLFEAGGSRNAFFVVVAGAVEIIDRSGDEPRTLVTHQPGEFTGDVDMLTGRVVLVTGRVARDGQVLELSAAALRQAVD